MDENNIKLPGYKVVYLFLLLGVVVLLSIPTFGSACLGGVDTAFYLKQMMTNSPENPSLWIPMILREAGASVKSTYDIYVVMIHFVTVMVSFICFKGVFKDNQIGIICTVLYAGAPSRLGALYARGDIAEVVSLSFLPVLVYGLYRVYCDRVDKVMYKNLWLLLTIGYTLVMQTYLLSYMIAIGVSILTAVLMWRRTIRKQTLLVWGKTFLAVTLCNFWTLFLLGSRRQQGIRVVEAFYDKSIQEYGVYPIQYLQTFFRYGTEGSVRQSGMANMQPSGIGLTISFCVIVFLWMLFVSHSYAQDEDYVPRGKQNEAEMDARVRMIFGCKMLIIGMIAMLLSLNSFPWDFIRKRGKVLKIAVMSLQSPARLVSFVTLLFTIVSGILLKQILILENKRKTIIFQSAVLIFAIVGIILMNVNIMNSAVHIDVQNLQSVSSTYATLEISPWDYMRFATTGVNTQTAVYVLEAISIVAVTAIAFWWECKCRVVGAFLKKD